VRLFTKAEVGLNSFGDVFLSLIVFFFWFMFIWIFIQIFADIFRRRDLTGGWKVTWILVLVLIPFLGALIYIIARPKDLAQDREEMAQMQAAQRAAIGYSSAEEIEKLAKLKDSGAITQEEYDAAKAKALGVM
jgi:TRAP-type C4-dicarboxylate transport system permease small subunit